jgi:hypothetical protein
MLKAWLVSVFLLGSLTLAVAQDADFSDFESDGGSDLGGSDVGGGADPGPEMTDDGFQVEAAPSGQDQQEIFIPEPTDPNDIVTTIPGEDGSATQRLEGNVNVLEFDPGGNEVVGPTGNSDNSTILYDTVPPATPGE